VYFGITTTPPGFVEPNPEFFGRMARLMDAVVASLGADDFFSPARSNAADEAREEISKLEAFQTKLEGFETVRDYMNTLPTNDAMMLILEMRLNDKNAKAAIFGRDAQNSKAALGDYIKQLKADALAYERGEKHAARDNAEFRARWDSLWTITRALEAMAHKQLRQQPWTKDEAEFLKKYGEKLAKIMGYFGNSYLSPRDDAPRWVEVARDPRRDTALAVAVGRPRYLYVLYPWNGMEILCQGSVMQYYEYEAKPTPLTDDEWLRLLDSPDAPPIPAWLRPFADAPEKPSGRR